MRLVKEWQARFSRISSFQAFKGQLPLRAASNSLWLSVDESEGATLIQHSSALASYLGNEEAGKP